MTPNTTTNFFPTEHYTISFWLSQQTDFSRFRSTKELPEEVDTLIIGSGYAGASVAHHLFEQDPNADVALYEARNICTGATGRNGGHLKPFCHRYFDRYLAMCGEEGAAEIVNSEFEHLWTIKRLVEELNVDCDFFLTRACDVYPYRNDPAMLRDLKCYDLLMKCPYVNQELKDQIQVFYGDAARIVSKSPTTDVAITYPAASLWPWKLIVALLKKSVDKGLNLQANTLVTEVKQRSDGKWVVKTPRGETACTKVVFATNGYTKALLSEFSNTIIPQRSVIARFVPQMKTGIPHLSHTYGLFTSLRRSDYLINRPDGSVVAGGQDAYLFDTSKTGHEAIPFFNTTDDSFFDTGAEQAFTESYMKDRFSTWTDVPVKVSHKWSGIVGFTNDHLPYIGELDCIGKPNAFICAGFHGHGMPRVYLCGKAVATCIATGKKIQEIPYTCPRAFSVSKERMEASSNVHEQELLDFAQNGPPKMLYKGV